MTNKVITYFTARMHPYAECEFEGCTWSIGMMPNAKILAKGHTKDTSHTTYVVVETRTSYGL